MRRTLLRAALRASATAAIAVALSACLNNVASRKTSSRSSASSNISAATANPDGAAGQCASFDVGNPTRALCIDCYSSVLSSRCPGKSAPSACADPVVVRDFSKLVNTCVANSIVAGFVCSKTCPSNLVLNSSTCSCETATSTGGGSTGTGGTVSVDSGQFDYGPPLLTLRPSALGEVVAGLAGGTDITSCTLTYTATSSGGSGHGLIIRNRGGTVPRNNIYSPPDSVSTSVNGNGAGFTYLSNPTNVTPVTGIPQINAMIGFTLRGSAYREFPGNTNFPSGATTFSGLSATLSSSSINSPATNWSASAADDGVGFGARDRFGNVYFVDRMTPEIKVVCYQSTGIGGHPCAAVTNAMVGTVRTAFNTGTAATGIAVDRFSNVYFSIGTAEVSVRCFQAGYYCGGGDVGNTLPLSGESGNFAFAGTVHGFDLLADATETKLAVIYADATNNRVYRACDFADATGPCAAAGVAQLIQSTDAISGTTLSAPRSVAIHPTTQSVYVSDTGRHRIVALCYNADASAVDPCGTNAVGTYVIAGTAGSPASSGDGATASAALVTSPRQLAFAKTTSEDNGDAAAFVTGINPNFRDNNLVFAEALNPATSTVAASGATVRVICGTTTATQPGFCTGFSRGTILRVAGVPGSRGTSANNSSSSIQAAAAHFSSPTGVAYDRFKNLIVSSTRSTVDGENLSDNALRSVQMHVASPRLAARYLVQDSNGLTSAWCFRFHLMTTCLAQACSCAVIAPLDRSIDAFAGVSVSDPTACQ